MEWLMILIRLLTGLVFAYLAFSVIYTLVFSIAGAFYVDACQTEPGQRRIAVLIPGYKEDSVIVEVARKALNQSYPRELYDVVVIADSFREETLEALRKFDIKLIQVQFEKSTKAKALNKALELLPTDYELAVILDADNIMEDDFLQKIDRNFHREMKVLQCHRTAKNLNSNIAVLDAISEEINNHLFRKGHRVFGFSAALIGSAMVFDYRTLLKYMPRIEAVGGFDKELDMRLINDKITIYYFDDAVVYDEKVQNSTAFVGQRKRWLSAQLVYLGRYFMKGLKGFFSNGNIDFLDKVLQMALVPRILLLGTLAILNILIYLAGKAISSEHLGDWLTPDPKKWALLFLLISISLILCIPRKHYSLKTLRAMFSLPWGFALMFWSLINVKGSNKRFIHTPHGTK
jgi:cellulose synthase/poly-beta-1,6-N-acetylglucosamine synthase-like glycosyltransferase